MGQFLFKVVCSTIKILHDLSSNRREPGWFLSLSLTKVFSTKGPIFLYIMWKKKKKKKKKQISPNSIKKVIWKTIEQYQGRGRSLHQR